MDNSKTDNERELTSTMGNVLSVSIKDEKNDTSGSDATPTSSTDANTTKTSSQIVSDDPISSTSSDIVELNKSKTLEGSMQNLAEISQTAMEDPDKPSSIDPETDLLEMNISSVSREKITEDVEDLVHDLESLLGESTDSFNIPIKRKDKKSAEENEATQKTQIPDERGDILSLEDPVLDTSVELGEDYNPEKNITKDVSNSPLADESGITEECKKEDGVNYDVKKTEANQSGIETEVMEENKEQTAYSNSESDEIENCDAKHPEASQSNVEIETPEETKEAGSEGIEQCEVKGTEAKESNNETEAVAEDKESSTYTNPESEASSVCQIETEKVQSEAAANDDKVDGSENVEESEFTVIQEECSVETENYGAEVEKLEVIAATEERSVEAESDSTVTTVQDVEKKDDLNEAEQTSTVSAEPTQEEAGNKMGAEDNAPNEEPDIPEPALASFISPAGDGDGNIQEHESPSKPSIEDGNVQKDEISSESLVTQKDEFEKTDEDNIVGQEETTARDTKTEDVEALDNEHKEMEYSKHEELESEDVDKSPIDTCSIAVEASKSTEDDNTAGETETCAEENQTVENISPEVSCEKVIDTESKSEVEAIENLVSKNLDLHQPEVPEHEDIGEQAMECQTNTSQEDNVNTYDVEVEVSDVNVTSETVTESAEDNVQELMKEIELVKNTKPTDIVELESQVNIPEPSAVLDSILTESVENVEDVQELIPDIQETLLIQPMDKPNADIKDMSTEHKDPKSPISIAEVCSTIIDSNEVDLTLEPNQDVSQTENAVEQTDDIIKAEDSEIESTTDQPTIVKVTEPDDEQIETSPTKSSVEIVQLEVKEPESEPSKDDIAQSEELSDVVMSIEEPPEPDTQTVTENVDEICEVEEIQSDPPLDIVPDHDENAEDELKQSTDVSGICEEVSTPQPELLQTEAAGNANIPITKSGDETSEITQDSDLQKTLIATEVIEQVITESAQNEDNADSNNEISELTNEIIKPMVISSVVEDSPKLDDNSELDQDQDRTSTIETVVIEDDKEEDDVEWIEDAAPNDNEDTASNIEIIQDDETENSNNKVIEILDDDSKTMEIESGSVPLFSTGVDSDSEDTVPTLVLEPDEVLPSPEPSSTEKVDDQTEEPSFMLHSPNVAEIPDKLPGIEEILNDQGNVDDVVENIDMQENLETILAVASLQSTDSTEIVEESSEPQISDKERREMEALRKAVESITDASTVDYIDEDDVAEVVENVTQSTQNVLPESETVHNLIEESDSDLKQADVVEESGEPEKQIDGSEDDKPIHDPIEQNVEASVNNVEATDDSKSGKTRSKQDLIEEIVQYTPDTSEDKVEVIEVQEANAVLPDSSQSVSLNEEINLVESPKEKEGKNKMNERPKRHKKSCADNKLEELSINVDVPEREKPYSPKVTIKPIRVPDEEVSTTSNSDSEVGKGSLKMTITKQSDKMHSVLKICESENSESVQEEDEPIPKLIIKPKMQQVEQQHSPKMSTRSSKQMYSPTSSSQRSGSPRITIKPVVKPDKGECLTPLKFKIKPDEGLKKHSPKSSTKPTTKSEDENIQSPRKIIIKPIVKPSDEGELIQGPRITIKPIPKPDLEKEPVTPRLNIRPVKKQEDEDIDVDRERSSPKITIKPVIKPQEHEIQPVEVDDEVKARIVLKINKGNLPTPTKESKKREHSLDDEKSEKLAKITVKFSKGGGHAHIVQQSEETNKRSHEEQSSPEKSKKQKTDNESPVLTRSKQKDVSVEHFSGDMSKTKQKDSESHVVETRSKHSLSGGEAPIEAKRAKLRDTPETSICELTRSKLKETLSGSPKSKLNNDNDDVRIIETKLDSPIVISEDSRSQDSGSCIIVEDVKDPLAGTTVFDISAKTVIETTPVQPAKQESASSTPVTPSTPTPRKRGRPRKVPIVVREEFKDQEEPPKPEAPKKEEPPLVHESGRPKRSCRGQSVRATLGIKPRKPRGPGRGRGGKRGMGTRVVPMKPEPEPKLSKAKLKLLQESLKIELLRTEEVIEKERKLTEQLHALEEEIKPPVAILTQREEPHTLPSILVPDSPQEPAASPVYLHGTSPKPAGSLVAAEVADSSGGPPATPSTSRVECVEIVMVDEETRMSADTNSRAQTPAKQVAPADVVIEESQSSVQSTATTESGKAAASSRPNKAPRLEVQEPEGAVISADQLTEYYWNGNGPFMLQEQVAQFLGIKSFKRKYPGIMRRMLEMQERDFIRESGLASEHMCDLGLTAVNSADILDIMYSDFQEKYEEYCKHQRDRQAKELINKQKALSLAASQDKNKADITEQAVQSAAQWNASFNKTRREQRKACMDLQTLTVHYPKGKMKQINKPKVGNYPVSLVPGQFTDYYKEFTPTEINNLPLNTLCYNEINIIRPEDSDDSGSDGSESDSDSSSSSSGSCSSSSGVEDCKLCKHSPKKGSVSK